jgi:hypothetical protein
MGVYFLDLVTPETYLHNTMDKTDIVYALDQYVETVYGIMCLFTILMLNVCGVTQSLW